MNYDKYILNDFLRSHD